MASELAERFMSALQETERTKDIGPLVSLFADDGEASNLAHREPHRGRDGLSRFWQEYLSAFQQVRSTFNQVVEGENAIVLEWRSEGRLPSGEPIKYPGVSILETDGEKVQRFRTYYDSAAFIPQKAST